MNKRVFACLFAPALPLQALVRSEPELASRPVAVVDGLCIKHVCRAAWEAGVRPGMTLTQARSIAPDTVIRTVPQCLVDAASQALLDVAMAKAPKVSMLRPDAVVIDLFGTKRLYPSHQALGCALEAAAERVGLRVRVAIASGPRIAFIIARVCPDVTVVPDGTEADFLAPLPFSTLCPSERLASIVEHLGIHTVGEFATLNRRSLGIRLGKEAYDLHRLACGEDDTHLEFLTPSEVFEESVALDYVVDNAEPLLFLMAAALERLVERIEQRQALPKSLHVELKLDPEGTHVLTVSMPTPTRDVHSLLSLIRITLDENPPKAPIRGLRLSATPGHAKPLQGNLFGPPLPEPLRLAGLLTRLVALAGPDAVGAPVLLETCSRDPAALRAFEGKTSDVTEATHIKPKLAFRRFRPPIEARVIVRNERPAHVEARQIFGPVVRAAGPWYADGAWWSETPLSGAAWDVEVRSLGLLRLWHDLVNDRWFIEGVYD